MIEYIDEVTGERFWSRGGNESPFEMGPGGNRKRKDRVRTMNFALRQNVKERFYQY